jgi:hypothetical protein
MKSMLYVALTSLILLATQSGFADDADTVESGVLETVPTVVDIHDPSFNRLVDLRLLGRAWSELDAAMLTDSALQFVEAERVLLRQRKGISADQLLLLSIRLAAETNDAQTLDRLAQVVPSRENEQLTAQLAQARKLAGTARDPGLELIVNIGELSSHEYDGLRGRLDSVTRYHVTNDPTFLEPWQDSPMETWGFSEEHSEKLQRIMGASRSTEADAAEPAVDRVLLIALDRLSSAARPDVGGSESWMPTMTVGENYGYDVTAQPAGGTSGDGYYGGVQINF